MKKVINKMRRNKKAFSLIEMSIVIVIVSILMVGGLMVSTNSMNTSAIKLSKQRMDLIYQSLGDYLRANKKLPCPAPLTVSRSKSSSYGKDNAVEGVCGDNGTYSSTTATDLVYGMVPVQDLGLSKEMAEDGFGSKFVYIIHKEYTKDSESPYTDTDSFGTNADSPLITIKEKQNGEQTVADDAVFVILSHGSNKLGAFNANSSSQNSAPSNSYEILNAAVEVSPNTATFTGVVYANAKGEVGFDDFIFYKNRNSLVQDFKAFTAIPCAGHAESLYETTMNWPGALYGQAVASNEDCPSGYTGGAKKATKKCGAFGSWQDGVINPCVPSHVGTCTGGDSTYTSAGRTFHVFTSDGDLVCINDPLSEVFAIGGGGGGAASWDVDAGYGAPGGGGGGGEYKLESYVEISGTVSVVIGAGGAGGVEYTPTAGSAALAGGDSTVSVLNITAKGGNPGADQFKINVVTNSDAPGGGSCKSYGAYASADKNGGNSPGADNVHGCGGGASQDNDGENGSSTGGGDGGAGFSYMGVVYGSGGGSGGGYLGNFGDDVPAAKGEAGGDDAGDGAYGVGYGSSYGYSDAEDGLDNRGGGGGGSNSAKPNGGDGGSGVVIFSYTTP